VEWVIKAHIVLTKKLLKIQQIAKIQQTVVTVIIVIKALLKINLLKNQLYIYHVNNNKNNIVFILGINLNYHRDKYRIN